jgi:hypothetical protein
MSSFKVLCGVLSVVSDMLLVGLNSFVCAAPHSRSPRYRSPSPRVAHHSRSYTPDRAYRHSYSPSPAPYQDVYSSPVRSNSRRRRDRSPPPTRRSPSPPHASRDYQLRSNDKDHYPDQYRRQQSSSHSPPSSRRQGREANYEGSPVSEHRYQAFCCYLLAAIICYFPAYF